MSTDLTASAAELTQEGPLGAAPEGGSRRGSLKAVAAHFAGAVAAVVVALVPGLPGFVTIVLAAIAAFLLFRSYSLVLTRRFPEASPGAVLGAIWLIGLVILSALAGVLALPEGLDPGKTLMVPIQLGPSLSNGHLLGTDTQGLDVTAGLLYGARVSLIVGIGGTLIGLVFGGLAGLLAGYLRGGADIVISYIVDVLLTFPALILLLAMVSFLSPSVLNITCVLGLLAFPGFARLSRANTIKLANREFVVSSMTLGASRMRIVFKSLLPNLVPSLFALSFITMSFLIVAEASLSFLGVGIQRPQPTWGNMIAQGQPTLQEHPVLVLAPSIAILFTVLSANIIGQRLQKRWGL